MAFYPVLYFQEKAKKTTPTNAVPGYDTTQNTHKGPPCITAWSRWPPDQSREERHLTAKANEN
jgi:hypothetical protein